MKNLKSTNQLNIENKQLNKNPIINGCKNFHSDPFVNEWKCLNCGKMKLEHIQLSQTINNEKRLDDI